MANPVYHTWQDAKQWLDAEIYARPDPAKLQALAAQTEQLFENRVRGRVTVPIDAAESPETFAQAKTICAMRTAATFALQANQAEGRDEMAWYPKWLIEQADEIEEHLASPHQGPTDRVDAPAPLAYLPSDGKTADERPAAIFTRDHITSGNSSHW